MIGNKFGPYEIRAEIGKGGMATVYRAYQADLQRDVAVKVIQTELIRDTSSVQRFQREARLIARLEHAHILPVYAFDGSHDPPYIVMRYVQGGTLKELLALGPLTFEQIGNLLRQIASGLDYAHEQGIIHRDVKPSNILLDQSGNVLVADFGIARAVNGSDPITDLTRPGSAVGTPGYMAPELSQGPEGLTPQADIYSLGVMFFEMSTGQMPYSAENSVALIVKQFNDPIPSAAAVNPRLPHAVDAVIARAMDKDYRQRFATATEFAEAAIEALNGAMGEGIEASESRQQKQTALNLSLSLLGSLQIVLNGQPVTGFDLNKVRALLIYLVMEQAKYHLRETLAEMLWPDQPDQVGRDSLRQALSKLRQAIGDHAADPPFLLISKEKLQFNVESHFTLDTAIFTDLLDQCEDHEHTQIETCTECIQRLEEAVELYRGLFAEGLTVRDSDAFEAWLSFKREYFQTRALDALFILTEHYQQRGMYDLARRYAWRQIELVPWREEAYRQLMRLLALSGQRSAALAQYERCCRVLKEELGIDDPSPETVALYKEILAAEIAPAQHAASMPALPMSNLPVVPASFIGREKEIARLKQCLDDATCRLVTVVGPGGMGKTRLALEVAHQSEDLFQGMYFVPLASLDSADLLAPAIADVLHFSTMSQDDFSTQLVNYLSDKTLLLVLDNMEHLVAGARLLSDIMARAPAVKLLVTSRERLNLRGEWGLDLQGLPIEEIDKGAVQLFAQRAQMMQSDFTLSDDTRSAIVRICQLVDGMPLGIELAAAWVQMLTCREIADSIANNLAFLTASTRDLPERQQSLRAVFEHSWELLSPELQRVFGALSVFRGGFQPDAALEVCGATLPMLLIFTNKSMLYRNSQGRYEIHELLRQYALEKLQESGESGAVFAGHLLFYVKLAEAAGPQIQSGQQVPWLARLEAENDNLRTALDWSITSQVPEVGLRLGAALWFFWHIRHYIREGLEWLDKLLALAPDAPPMVRSKALFAAGWLAQNNRELRRAEDLAEASLQLARQIGDKRSIAYPLSTVAWLNYFTGEYGRATTFGEESLALFREVNDSWGIVHVLNILGFIAESQADYPRAEMLQREGMIIARAAGDSDGLAWSTYLLGRSMAERSENDEAIVLFTQSLEIYRELGNNWGIALIKYSLAESTVALGDLARAGSLAEESVRVLQEMSDFWAIGGPLSCLGLVAYREGDLARASKFLEESLYYFRKYGDRRGVALALNRLGCVASRQGQAEYAADLFKESLSLRREAGIPHGMEMSFEQLGVIAAARGDATRAARLFGAAESLRKSLKISMADADLEQHKSSLRIVQKQLGDSAFTVAWTEGGNLPLDEVITYALEDV